MNRTDFIRICDRVAEISRAEGVKISSACYILFDELNIAEEKRHNLCSEICRELGRRGGKKSGRIRLAGKSQGKANPRKVKDIIKMIEWEILKDGARAHERWLMESHPDP